MKILLLDTKTKQTATYEGGNLFWWAEGNGSCDCNRVIPFGKAVEEELENEVNGCGVCFGHNRFLAIDIIVDDDKDVAAIAKNIKLEQINQRYPKELIEEAKQWTH